MPRNALLLSFVIVAGCSTAVVDDDTSHEVAEVDDVEALARSRSNCVVHWTVCEAPTRLCSNLDLRGRLDSFGTVTGMRGAVFCDGIMVANGRCRFETDERSGCPDRCLSGRMCIGWDRRCRETGPCFTRR
jgi:hypothetical protein